MQTTNALATNPNDIVSEQLARKSCAYQRRTNRADARTPAFNSSKAMQRAKDVTRLNKPERTSTKDKGLHWFMSSTLKRLDNPKFKVREQSTFQRLFASLPRKNVMHGMRKEVFDVAMVALFEMVDHVTGFLEYGNISSLSGRLDLTTYGKALYIGKDKVNGTDREHLGKPKASTKRTFNFLSFLRDLRFVEMDSINCPITGERLPSIIRVTDHYYAAIGVSANQLKSFREQKLARTKYAFMHGIEVEDYEEHVKAMIFHKREQMKSDRIAYRRKLRLSQRLKRLTPTEVYQYGRKLVKGRYSNPELADMSDEHYNVAVKNELDNLFNAASLRVPPLIH